MFKFLFPISKIFLSSMQYVNILNKSNMEMTLFRGKNVFFIAHTLFSIKKTSNCNEIDYYFRVQNHLEYVDLKSEIFEVSAHLSYFRANLKDIQFNFKIKFLYSRGNPGGPPGFQQR